MAERVEPLITVRPKLEVAFPDEPDEAGRRDGITNTDTNNTAPRRLGARAWWLVQLIAGTPLSFWPAKTAMTPAQLVDANPGDVVILGWARAAERQRNPQWARLLFARHRSAALLKALPTGEAAALAETALGTTTDAKWPVVYALLDAVAGPWPESLSRVAVERYRQADPLSIQLAAGLLAARLSPVVAPLVDQWANNLSDYRARREVRSLHHALTLRKTIAEEFA
jgi:hypothetical protein